MSMWYLGLGVGHLNLSNFPKEHDILWEDLLSEEGEARRFRILEEESDDEFSESENGNEEHNLMEED